MTTLLPVILSAVLCSWAFLTIVGGERTRRVTEAEAAEARRKAIEEAEAEQQAARSRLIPIASSPASKPAKAPTPKPSSGPAANSARAGKP